MEAIFTRRSVRSFNGQTVEPEKIDRILRAAMQAPSAINQQPWEFIVVRGQENLNALAAFNPYAKCLTGASVGIVVLSNNERMRTPDYWQQDLGAATQNILLEATSLGLGTVWFGTAPMAERMSFIQELYQLPKTTVPYSVIAVGYPAEADANHFIDRFDETRIRYIGE